MLWGRRLGYLRGRRGSAWEEVAMRERRQVRAREQREGGGEGDGQGGREGGDGGAGAGGWNHGGGWWGQAKRVVARARKPIMRWRWGSSLERPMGGGRRWGVGAWAGWVVRWEVKAGGVSGAGESEVRGGPCWVGGGGGTGGEGERDGEKEGEG